MSTTPNTGSRRRTSRGCGGGLSVSLFGQRASKALLQKRVSFSPAVMTKTITPRTSDEERLSLSSSSSGGGKRKYPNSPHPSTVKKRKLVKDASAPPVEPVASAKTPVKRRKTKRRILALFSSAATVKSRPGNTLTAQLSFVLDTMPAKKKKLMDNSKMCRSTRIYELGKLEDEMLKRLEIVSNIKIDPNTSNQMYNRKFEVIEEMQEKLMMLQQLKREEESRLMDDRLQLRIQLNGFHCCHACVDKEKKSKMTMTKKKGN